MPLNDITFQVLQGGLGRTSAGEDHVSGILFDLTAPSAYDGAAGKAYGDLDSVVADGMTEGHATYGEVYYHAREFFRIAPGSTLWIFFEASYTDMNTLAEGRLRQVGVFFTDFADITAVHQAGVTALTALHAPLQVLAGYQGPALTLGSVADQGANTAPQVAVLLAGDGDADGAALADDLSVPYIPAVGAVLGAMAKAAVHESIAWVEKFNLSDGNELEVIRLADGNNSPSNSTLSALNDKRYLVLRKHVGISGSYLNDSHTATDETGDFAYIESNRTIQKARREIRRFLLPQLNAPLTVDGDTGKLAPGSVRFFENLTARPLNQMQAAGEVSAFGVFVNPDQDVLSTSLLQVQVKIVPRGVARNITVLIGFSVTTEF
jgi:hypothetical protein